MKITAKALKKLKKNDNDAAASNQAAVMAINKKEAKEAKKEEAKEKVVEAQKKSEKAVKKTQKAAEKAIKKVVAKQESAPGGIVDIISKALAKNAKEQATKEENRARVEGKIKTKAAATDTAIGTTRKALKSGFAATRDLSAAESKKELEKAAASPVVTED